MTYSGFRVDIRTPIVLDTSVLINLHASQYGNRILDVVPNDVIVPSLVRSELEHETSTARGGKQFIQRAIDTGRVRVVGLCEQEYRLFGNLVSGSPSLGDGEAATIAMAVCRRYWPVIDERKGRNLAQERLLGESPGWSLDLFRHPRVAATLGTPRFVEAIFLALRDGRMRIDERDCEMVVRIIGVRRALKCKSLPGYKSRRVQWMATMGPSATEDRRQATPLAVRRGA